MKQRIRLTESDLHRIVKESVDSVLNEISKDTVASAKNGAFKKWQALDTDPYAKSAERDAAYDQYKNFEDEYSRRKNYKTDSKGRMVRDEYGFGVPSSDRQKAKFEKDLRNMKSGNRKYVDGPTGKRWRDVGEN